MKRTARNVSIKHLLLLSLLTPAVCGLLHVLTPGGVVGSHLTVLTVAALVLSLAHTLLLYPTHRPRVSYHPHRHAVEMYVWYCAQALCVLCYDINGFHFLSSLVQ